MSPDIFLPGGPACPWRTADLPPIEGYLEPLPEHFRVQEIPAYEAEGVGDHWLIEVEKRGLTSTELRALLARAAGVSPREVGMAGRKDRVAITRQWFSLPVEPVDPGHDQVRLLERARHPRKLRMGHLRGNRFEIRLTLGAGALGAGAAARLPALLARIATGIPNYFGPQRFGRDPARLEDLPDRLRRRRRSRDARFEVSVLQSAVFNHWLGARCSEGLLDTALAGDVLRRRETGGLFNCTDPEVDGGRIASGELDPTGPMPGTKTRWATPESAAASREWQAMEALGLPLEWWRGLGRLAPGTRRVARVVPEVIEARIEGEALALVLVLPSGSYATCVLSELLHRADARSPRADSPTGEDRRDMTRA